MEVIINTGITWNFGDSKEQLAELIARILDKGEVNGSDWYSDGEDIDEHEKDNEGIFTDSVYWSIDQVFTDEDRRVTKVQISC